MRNFLQIAGGLDINPTLLALSLNSDLWNENDLRTKHPGTVHAEVDDIWLLFNRIPVNVAEVMDDVSVIPYRAWNVLHALRAQVLDLLRRVEGIQLGRVMVTRMKPGSRIYPHVDQGAPAELFDRYHIALQNLPGSVFRIGDESMTYNAGEVWWIDNQVEHEVINNSKDDRLAVVVDVRRK